jgi:hypothetical protein
MKIQVVTPYRVSHLQRYGVTVRGNVTSVYPLCVCRYVSHIAIPDLKFYYGLCKYVAARHKRTGKSDRLVSLKDFMEGFSP